MHNKTTKQYIKLKKSYTLFRMGFVNIISRSGKGVFGESFEPITWHVLTT